MDNIYLIAAAWIGLALLASVISLRLGISVALVELFLGVLAGNALHFQTTAWIDFLASFGSVLLTFLAGAEIDPESLRRQLKPSLAIGALSFLLPFLGALACTFFVLHWELRAAEIAGIALSTTSVAVVYAVMIETGLNTTDLGKLILAACFVTDLDRIWCKSRVGSLLGGYARLVGVWSSAPLTRRASRRGRFPDEIDNEAIAERTRESRSARQRSASPSPLGEQSFEILASRYHERLAVHAPQAPQAEAA